jgi:hypothetical protein
LAGRPLSQVGRYLSRSELWEFSCLVGCFWPLGRVWEQSRKEETGRRKKRRRSMRKGNKRDSLAIKAIGG